MQGLQEAFESAALEAGQRIRQRVRETRDRVPHLLIYVIRLDNPAEPFVLAPYQDFDTWSADTRRNRARASRTELTIEAAKYDPSKVLAAIDIISGPVHVHTELQLAYL
jgi:hypothetical protein